MMLSDVRVRLWAVVVTIVVATAVFGYVWDGSARAWEGAAASAERAAESSRELAAHEAQLAEVMEARGDSLALLAAERGRRVRQRVVEVRAVVLPDSCAPLVAPRDLLIDTLIVESDTWRAAYESQARASAHLRVSYVSLEAANAELLTVMQDRPRPKPRWAPAVGVGAFAGVCVNGRACLGAGLTFSWRIP